LTTVDNILPNVQNQLVSGISWITKQNSAGSGPQSEAACSGFETTNNQPTINDFAANAYAGPIRPLLLRKGASTNEVYEWNVPSVQLGAFQGRTVTCEMAVSQKVQGATGTWQVFVND
jgi:hypothetical protein